MNEKELQDLANLMRRDVAKMTFSAGSGHPSSCFSAAELMSVLFFDEMKYDVKNADNPDNDEFILSKGHAAPILYSALSHAGCIKQDLMKLRKLASPLEGHPMPRSLKWIKVATGSLGQGPSIGLGFALAGKLQGRKFRTYVLAGDSEMAEGSVFEALQLAPQYNLDNLCLIIDANRLGQRGETMLGTELKRFAEGIKSFNWHTIIVDGHNIEEIKKAFAEARKVGMPTAIIAKTMKGKGVSFMENQEGWHGRAMDKEELKKALQEIPDVKEPKIKIVKSEKIEVDENKKGKLQKIHYDSFGVIATRMAFGKAAANLAQSDSRIIGVDAEVGNSTYLDEIKKVRPGQYIQTFIAEQDLVGICLGLSKKSFKPIGATFAAFLSRAHDQLRMSALSNGDFTICGSHAGVSIGEDGASQMGLEDIALFRTLPGATIFYPSDAISAEKLTYITAKTKGLKYIRTTRGKTPVLYEDKEDFKIGDFKVLRQSAKDKIVLVGSGITLHECLAAHEKLKDKKIESAVVDLYCVKPFDSKKFISFAKKHGKKILIAEDHYAEGGIGEMLAEELENSGIEVKHLAVHEIPHSGKSEELLEKYGIGRAAIAKSAEKLVK